MFIYVSETNEKWFVCRRTCSLYVLSRARWGCRFNHRRSATAWGETRISPIIIIVKQGMQESRKPIISHLQFWAKTRGAGWWMLVLLKLLLIDFCTHMVGNGRHSLWDMSNDPSTLNRKAFFSYSHCKELTYGTLQCNSDPTTTRPGNQSERLPEAMGTRCRKPGWKGSLGTGQTVKAKRSAR